MVALCARETEGNSEEEGEMRVRSGSVKYLKRPMTSFPEFCASVYCVGASQTNQTKGLEPRLSALRFGRRVASTAVDGMSNVWVTGFVVQNVRC